MYRPSRPPKDPTDEQRARISRLFLRPLLFCFVPAMLTAITVAWLVEVPLNARLKLEGWRFLALIVPATILSGLVVQLIGLGLFLRRLLRYRTGRRGRRHALLEFLRPSDVAPGTWRRLELAAYGVGPDDLRLYGEARQPGGIA